MSLEEYLQILKCLSSLDAGILWFGLIGQCTNLELLTFNLMRDKKTIIKKPLLFKDQYY